MLFRPASLQRHETAASFFAAGRPCAVAQDTALAGRIRSVENGLIPYVPVRGFPSWTLAERMRHYGVPGVSIAVIRDFRIDWAKGYGLADTLRNIPVTTETLFSAGSISKLVLAMAALRQVQEGTLALDAPVNRYLRSWKIEENEWTRATPVTLRMLLSHTGSTIQSSYFGFPPGKKPLPGILDILNGSPSAESRKVIVNSAPGKEFRYSGGGSMIAQLLLMESTRRRFEDLTEQTVFRPLGMRHSTFEQPLLPALSRQASEAYSVAPWFRGMPYVYPQQAAAGLYSTPSDLARFFINLQRSYAGSGTVLQQATARQMFRPQVKVSEGFYREEMGLGPFLLQQYGNRTEKG
ncbi:MAG TPA: serine hydrolase domain-containing protein, partial [Chitinophagaceae bacterium]|nr:serine hydrolase domain-containing protein [Chitinophagaceae bacterium]